MYVYMYVYMYVCVCICMSAQTNYSMLPQSTYYLPYLITGFPGHSNGPGYSDEYQGTGTTCSFRSLTTELNANRFSSLGLSES